MVELLSLNGPLYVQCTIASTVDCSVRREPIHLTHPKKAFVGEIGEDEVSDRKEKERDEEEEETWALIMSMVAAPQSGASEWSWVNDLGSLRMMMKRNEGERASK